VLELYCESMAAFPIIIPIRPTPENLKDLISLVAKARLLKSGSLSRRRDRLGVGDPPRGRSFFPAGS